MRLGRTCLLMGALLLLAIGCGKGETRDTRDTAGDGADSGRPDDDRDGYGEPEDCDDADPMVNPNGIEVCNGQDDDCDGLADEEAVDAKPWSMDLDGDGFGSDVVESACQPPSGYVEDGGDCDDTDEDIHPNADETCDGVDNDCDLETDEACSTPPSDLDLDRASVLLIGATNGERFGSRLLSWGGDLTGDGAPDLLVGSQVSDHGTSSGAAWLFRGPLSGTLPGNCSLAVGDSDQDGKDDLLAGLPDIASGLALLYLGVEDGTFTEDDASYRLTGANGTLVGLRVGLMGGMLPGDVPAVGVSWSEEEEYSAGAGLLALFNLNDL